MDDEVDEARLINKGEVNWCCALGSPPLKPIGCRPPEAPAGAGISYGGVAVKLPVGRPAPLLTFVSRSVINYWCTSTAFFYAFHPIRIDSRLSNLLTTTIQDDRQRHVTRIQSPRPISTSYSDVSF